MIEHPPPPPPLPPDPGVPDDALPVASPNPAAVDVKSTPELNMAFHTPFTFVYAAVIFFHVPSCLNFIPVMLFYVLFHLTLASTLMLNINTALPLPPASDPPDPPAAMPEA